LKKEIVFYNNYKETITLGGVLFIRKECELKIKKNSEINLIFGKKLNYKEKNIINKVFSSKKYKYKIFYSKNIKGKTFLNSQNKSEYYSLSELNRLIKKDSSLNLDWKPNTLVKAKMIRKKFKKTLVTMHLKYTKPFNERESNISPTFWNKFFDLFKNETNLDFLILGADESDKKIKKLSNIFWAKKMNISLDTQLCLISLSDQYLGMASGISGAAMLTNNPYLIFKNKFHHSSQMKKEINKNKTFFAKKKQYIFLEKPNLARINKYSILDDKKL
jgi:hypothetical protein